MLQVLIQKFVKSSSYFLIGKSEMILLKLLVISLDGQISALVDREYYYVNA